MNNDTTKTLSRLHWMDAMDEGLLTLESECLLMQLPSALLPRLTCLLAPQLLNQLVLDRIVHNVECGPSTEGWALQLKTLQQQLGPYAQAVEVELANLNTWLGLTQEFAEEPATSLAA